MQRGVEPLRQQRLDPGRGGALLREDAIGELHGLPVPGAFGHTAQQLVAGDLEMLERVGERRQLPRRIGMGLEEEVLVEAAETHRRVLEDVGGAAELLEPLLDEAGVYVSFLQMLLEQRREA